MNELMLAFLFAFISTLGFSILFHVPKKHIFFAAIVGGSGWFFYATLSASGNGNLISCFFAACVVATLGDLFSRFRKEASTIFIIPGILPLVPGSGMYYTMLAIVNGNLSEAASLGMQTLLLAGSIAVALLVVSSLIRVIVMTKRSIQKLLS